LPALCGYLLSGFSGGASLNMGEEYLLASIAVVVIGGTSVAGGFSNVPGLWGAALFMFLLVTMLNTFGAARRCSPHHDRAYHHRGHRACRRPQVIALARQKTMALVGDSYEYIDRAFRDLTIPIAKVECLFDGCLWAEGPVWFADANQLVWSDIPNRRMLRWVPELGVSVFRADSNYANGNTRDRQGRLVTCEHGTRRVTRTEADGTITVIADSFNGKRLNSPNDVVVKSDGSIWFTDPTYGILTDYEGFKADPEQQGCYVFRADAETGKLSLVADDFVKPNGLAFSPDERLLYIADSGFSHDPSAPHHIRAFDVVAAIGDADFGDDDQGEQRVLHVGVVHAAAAVRHRPDHRVGLLRHHLGRLIRHQPGDRHLDQSLFHTVGEHHDAAADLVQAVGGQRHVGLAGAHNDHVMAVMGDR
jgi:gluconolactonase